MFSNNVSECISSPEPLEDWPVPALICRGPEMNEKEQKKKKKLGNPRVPISTSKAEKIDEYYGEFVDQSIQTYHQIVQVYPVSYTHLTLPTIYSV